MSAFIESPGQSGRESFRFGRSIIAALVCGLIAVVSHAAEPKLLKVPADGWKIEIVPGPAIGPSPTPKIDRAVREAQAAKSEALVDSTSGVVTAGADSAMPAGITSASYIEVYNSIPFRRSEYAANPNYRHEATIELLLGQIRPKTVVNASVSTPSATCCSPRAVSYVGLFNPWGAKNFYYHHSYSRPSSYWVW